MNKAEVTGDRVESVCAAKRIAAACCTAPQLKMVSTELRFPV
jgi:hypothetical protein